MSDGDQGQRLELYQALLAAQGDLGVGISVTDVETARLVWFNDALCAMHGYTREEMAALPPEALTTPEDAALLVERIRAGASAGTVADDVEIAGLRKGGERRIMRVSVRLQPLAGRPSVVALVRDVTERRRAESQRAEIERRQRVLVETSTDLLGICSPDGVWRYASPACKKLFGYEPEEMVGRQGFEFVHPEDLGGIASALAEGLSRPADAVPIRYRQRRKDGSWVWVESIGWIVRDEAGAVAEIRFSIRDITSRVEAEEKLRRSEESFRALIEQAPDGIIVHHDGTIAYVNDALLRMLGYASRRELEGTLGADLVHPDDRPLLAERYRTMERTGRGVPPIEARLLRRDGGVLFAEGAGLPLTFQGRKAILVMVRDVSERRRAQAQLAQADRLASVGTLAAGVAHEINNPLTAVIANLEYAADELARLAHGPLRDELGATLADARDGAERVRRIVRDLSIFSRADGDRVLPVDVERVLESSIQLTWNEIRHRAALVRDYQPAPPAAANEARLGQVFVNLLLNAVQSLPPGAADRNVIRVAVREAGGRVVIEVADSGSGIAPEIVGRIFDPFFTTKPVGLGTGLGLSVCHGLVTQLGGTIAVESEVGRGSTFRVALPVDAASSARALPSAERANTRRRGRVLVVDDEPMIGQSVRRVLAADHDVTVAQSVDEALAALAGAPYDLVLCDLMMPVRTGMDLHAELAARAPGDAEKLVFLTGGAFTPEARDFLARVANRCVEKPFDRAALRALVRERVG